MAAKLTDERRTDDQGPVTMGGDRACDLLLFAMLAILD
jgi:hypothetical protein